MSGGPSSGGPFSGSQESGKVLLKLLGVSTLEVSHYRFFGLEDFVADPDAIESAADRTMAHLKTFSNSDHAELAQQLLNRAAQIRTILLHAQKKAAYDQQLQQARLAAAPPVPAPTPTPAPAPAPIRPAAAAPPRVSGAPPAEVEPPRFTFADVSAPSQAGPRPGPRKKSDAILWGSLGGLVLLVLGGVAIWIASSGPADPVAGNSTPGSSTPGSTTPGSSTTSTPAPSSTPAPLDEKRTRADELFQTAQAVADRAKAAEAGNVPEAAKLYREAAQKISEAASVLHPMTHADALARLQPIQQQWTTRAGQLEQQLQAQMTQVAEQEQRRKLAVAQAAPLLKQAQTFREEKKHPQELAALEQAQKLLRDAQATAEAEQINTAILAARRLEAEQMQSKNFAENLQKQREQVQKALSSLLKQSQTDSKIAPSTIDQLRANAQTAEPLEGVAMRLEALELAVHWGRLANCLEILGELERSPGVSEDFITNQERLTYNRLAETLKSADDLLALSRVESSEEKAVALLKQVVLAEAARGNMKGISLVLDTLDNHPHAAVLDEKLRSELLVQASEAAVAALPKRLAREDIPQRLAVAEFLQEAVSRHKDARDFDRAVASLDLALDALKGILPTQQPRVVDMRKEIQEVKKALETDQRIHRRLAALRENKERTPQENRELARLSIETGEATRDPESWAALLVAWDASGDDNLKELVAAERALMPDDPTSLITTAAAWKKAGDAIKEHTKDFHGRAMSLYRAALNQGNLSGIRKTQAELAMNSLRGLPDWGPGTDTGPRVQVNAAEFAGDRPGKEWRENGLKMVFCWIPPGSFTMGSPGNEPGRDGGREAQVPVTLTRGFWMGKFEVTQEEFEKLMGTNPSPNRGMEGLNTKRLPVLRINWATAEQFCQKMTALEFAAGRLPAGWEYRLPTDAQWEYACRAGTTTATYFGESFGSKQLNYNGERPYNGGAIGPNLGRPTEVGSYPSNAWGLHDMLGNASEWCRDYFVSRAPGGTDPEVTTPQREHVSRGGNWRDNDPVYVRAARRNEGFEGGEDGRGLRVVIAFTGAVAPSPLVGTNPLPQPTIPTPPPKINAPIARAGHVITNGMGMKFAYCPPTGPNGFLRGSPATEKDREPDETQHKVILTEGFYLGIHEVTVGQFRQFVTSKNYRTEGERDGKGGHGYNMVTGRVAQKPEYTWRNPGFTQTDMHPVVNVSWNDAVAYCAWLSRQDGKSYRLPTEAEWEYACRAGSTTMYQHGNDPEGLAQVGNVADASAKRQFNDWTDTISADDGYAFTAPVARYRANAWGLYDLHGNVWEWCSDWYGDYPAGTVTNPTGPPQEAMRRILRGGSLVNYPRNCRSADRLSSPPGYRSRNLGFRVARVQSSP